MRRVSVYSLIAISPLSVTIASCADPDASSVSPQSADLLISAIDHVEGSGDEVFGGTSGSGQAGDEATVEFSVNEERVSLYAACRGDLGDGEIIVNETQVHMVCNDEGSVEMIEPAIRAPDSILTVKSDGLPASTEWSVVAGNPAD